MPGKRVRRNGSATIPAMKKSISILLVTSILTPFALPSCSTPGGNVALGAVGTAAVIKAADDKKKKEQRDDYYWYKQQQKKKNER